MPKKKVKEETVDVVGEDEETVDAAGEDEEIVEPVLAATPPRCMETRVDRLRQALELIIPAVPRKATLPVLTNVLLKNGKAIGTDLDTAVIVNMPDIDGEGLLPARKVLDLLKYVGGFQKLTIEYKRGKVTLSWDGGKATYDVAKPDSFPEVSVPEYSEGNWASLEGDAVVNALVAAVPYCATDQARPVLAGVALHLGEGLVIAGADGFRLSYQELDMVFPLETTVVIQAGSVSILEFLWKRVPPAVKPVDDLIAAITAKRMLNLGVVNGSLVVEMPNVTMVSKLIQGTPPDYKQLIPKDGGNVVFMGASELERGLRRLKDSATGNSGIARLSWKDNLLTLTAKGGEAGEVETTIPVITETPGKIAFDISYLLDYLRGKTDLVKLITTNPQSPALLQYKSSPQVILMPMHAGD